MNNEMKKLFGQISEYENSTINENRLEQNQNKIMEKIRQRENKNSKIGINIRSFSAVASLFLIISIVLTMFVRINIFNTDTVKDSNISITEEYTEDTAVSIFSKLIEETVPELLYEEGTEEDTEEDYTTGESDSNWLVYSYDTYSNSDTYNFSELLSDKDFVSDIDQYISDDDKYFDLISSDYASYFDYSSDLN